LKSSKEQTLFERLDAAGKMPTPPTVVVRLLDLAKRADVSAKEMADIIGLDPALTAKVLRFVNSPMSGVARDVTSLPQAVALIGIRAVKMMALSFAVIGKSKEVDCREFNYEQFVLESLACGTAARTLAYTNRWAPAQEAFVAGLLSQIGWSALARALPEQYAEVLHRAKRVPRDLPVLELAAFGETYATVGGQLLRSWSLPETLCEAVCDFRNDIDGEMKPSLALLLNIAEAAAMSLCPYRPGDLADHTEFMRLAGKHLGLGEKQCLELLGKISEEVRQARDMFDLPTARVRSIEEIEEAIREGITELSLAMHMENRSLVQQQEELLRRATTDQLTGVGNRASFDARLNLELERTLRSKEPLGLLMIDVDHFKKLNDTYGHQAGDRVLHAVAQLFDEHIRKVDYVARYGGEEFTVIVPSTQQEGLLYLAERLRSGVEAIRVRWESKDLRITISVGAAILQDVASAQEAAAALIRAADEQLYVAKSAGRNRVVFQSSVAPQKTVREIATKEASKAKVPALTTASKK